MKNQYRIFTTTYFALGFFALCVLAPLAQAVVPAPDGGYPGGNTAEGTSPLLRLSTGTYNTAVGLYSLLSLTDGKFCTGVGAGTLLSNTADQNTAIGAGALLSNTTGTGNTGSGAFTLFSNTTGGFNTANGIKALFSNTVGIENTAIGFEALFSNIDGIQNTASGAQALLSNTSGGGNTAIGYEALQDNTTGSGNIALGFQALIHGSVGNLNIAIGGTSLFNTTGNNNIALGTFAGSALTSGSSNIDIGNAGVAGESGTIRIGNVQQDRAFIAGIRGATVGGNAIAVVIDSDGQLGTTTVSSKRFKKEIRPMDKASEAILALKPVTFHYKSDKTNAPQFGLIAEEVAEINPDLVVRDQNGEIYTVRYDAVNAMLLNEFLKEHRKVERQDRKIQEQEATIGQLRKEMETVVARLKKHDSEIQRVNDRLQTSSPGAQVVATGN
jgi:hypothetical protein